LNEDSHFCNARHARIYYPTMTVSWLPVIVIALVCVGICVAIAQRKNLGVGEAVVLGALLGVIGIVIMLIRKPGLPKAPAGMRAVRCPRCNTVQNIPHDDTSYDCYQCHNGATVKAILPERRSR
jgi:hypothetical protein